MLQHPAQTGLGLAALPLPQEICQNPGNLHQKCSPDLAKLLHLVLHYLQRQQTASDTVFVTHVIYVCCLPFAAVTASQSKSLTSLEDEQVPVTQMGCLRDPVMSSTASYDSAAFSWLR